MFSIYSFQVHAAVNFYTWVTKQTLCMLRSVLVEYRIRRTLCSEYFRLGTCPLGLGTRDYLGSRSTTIAIGRPDNKQNCCRTGEDCECECEELHFRRGSPLACGVMCFVSSSSIIYHTSAELLLAVASWLVAYCNGEKSSLSPKSFLHCKTRQ